MDIYNHNASVSIISIGDSPNVINHFPMAAWKQKAITAIIMSTVFVASAGAGLGISAGVASAAQLVSLAVGAGIGAMGGTLDAVIYSNDNQDYSQFADRVKDGVVTGIRAASLGMAIRSYINYNNYVAEKAAADAKWKITFTHTDDPDIKNMVELTYRPRFYL